MKFNHLEGYESVTLPTETVNGKRYYVTPSGNKYPSVTTVTGMHNAKWVAKWRKNVGAEKADKISAQADWSWIKISLYARRLFKQYRHYR